MKLFFIYAIMLCGLFVYSSERTETYFQDQAIRKLGPYKEYKKGDKIIFRLKNKLLVNGKYLKQNNNKIYIEFTSGNFIAYKLDKISTKDLYKFSKEQYDKKLAGLAQEFKNQYNYVYSTFNWGDSAKLLHTKILKDRNIKLLNSPASIMENKIMYCQTSISGKPFKLYLYLDDKVQLKQISSAVVTVHLSIMIDF